MKQNIMLTTAILLLIVVISCDPKTEVGDVNANITNGDSNTSQSIDGNYVGGNSAGGDYVGGNSAGGDVISNTTHNTTIYTTPNLKENNQPFQCSDYSNLLRTVDRKITSCKNVIDSLNRQIQSSLSTKTPNESKIRSLGNTRETWQKKEMSLNILKPKIINKQSICRGSNEDKEHFKDFEAKIQD